MSRPRLILDFLARGAGYSYGSHRSQRADLHLPAGAGPHPLMVLIHGGSWHKRYGKVVMRGLVGDLTRRGWAVWNIEYRRLGEGGGWPATFADVAEAIDYLGELDAPIDLQRAGVIGHSAGGHLALWAAGREKLPAGVPGAAPKVQFGRVVSMAGVADLTTAYRDWHGGAAGALMGGSPEELPERYDVGDPIRLLPLSMPTLLVHGVSDETVSVGLSRNYARDARAAGASVELIEIEGEAGRHRAHIDPHGESWAAVIRWLSQPLPD